MAAKYFRWVLMSAVTLLGLGQEAVMAQTTFAPQVERANAEEQVHRSVNAIRLRSTSIRQRLGLVEGRLSEIH